MSRAIGDLEVTKRCGTREKFQAEKVHRVLEWACGEVRDVSSSQIQLKLVSQLYPGISTDKIHEILIQSASELITEETPNYQWVASRLRGFKIRKQAYGTYDPPTIREHVVSMVEQGVYTRDLVEKWSEDDYAYLEKHIDHDRDETITSAGMEQMRIKYLAQNRVKKIPLESPQMLNMLVSMMIFSDEPKDRLRLVVEFYDMLSTGIVSLPTPIMCGLRLSGEKNQFSSCVLIECADSLDSIKGTSNAIIDYVSQRAGIGIEGGHLRAVDSEIRGGQVRHTGVTSFYRLFQNSVKSCFAGGVRSGAATLYYPLWHYEIETMLSLKNEKGTEDNRVRQIDYGVQINGYLRKRFLAGKDITLFSPHEVPDLHRAFFADQEEFARLYEHYERCRSVKQKKKIPARELFETLHTERMETGRIYILNVDHANNCGPFDPEVDPIKMSNLCAEITLPTRPVSAKDPNEGLIQLCTLAAMNASKFKHARDYTAMRRPLHVLVRALDNILTLQAYPVEAARKATAAYRPLGIGLFNMATWLAENDFTYSGMEGLQEFHSFMEHFQYYLIEGSSELAAERGYFPEFPNSKWAKGIMPIHRYYAKNLDKIVKPVYSLDWEALAEKVRSRGVRNSTLSAFMPVETSSQVVPGGATNGFDPPQTLVTAKGGDGEGKIRSVVPSIGRLKNKFELLYDQKSPQGYLTYVAVAQKFICQSVSANTWYNLEHYPNGRVPLDKLIEDDMRFYSLGGKTLYYCKIHDGSSDEVPVEKAGPECADGVCKL